MDEKKLVRCFIALELDPEVISFMGEIQNLIKKKNFFYGKFTETENLHLTLKFLGEIEEEKIEAVKKRLEKIKFKKFEASLGGLGVFINRYNSILWLKLNGIGIWDLQKEIDLVLNDIFSSEEFFMGHITLARMKKIINKEGMLDYIKNMKQKKFKFIIKDFCFKKSELRSDGPVYSNLERYSLK